MAAARNLFSPRKLRCHTYYHLIGLLATTGMRSGEAVRLANSDVNLAEGVITIHDSKFGKSRAVPLHPTTVRALPMNVTTKKSECDRKQRVRQLEVAIEHALAAATASHLNTAVKAALGCGMVEVSYPSFEFRETLRTLRSNAELDGIWVVIDLGGAATVEACKAACTILWHYYPDEMFVISTVPVTLAS